ncbi:hypothetical protein DFJ74DRAFT_740134 [Hyaloraphidium curvatum]|nr:hypothetical protein DFJ74DRAFT_740134 [Hyaloraphidium curvatum]
MGPHRRPWGRLRLAAAALFVSLSARLRLADAGHNCTYGQGPTLSSAILYERLAFDAAIGVVSCRGNVPAPGGTVGGGQGVADFYPLQGSVPARDALYPGSSIAVDGLLNGIGTKDFAVIAWIWPHVGDQERGVLIDAIGPGFRDARLYLGVGLGRFEADIWTGTDLQSLQAGAPDIYGSPSVPKWIHVGVTSVGKEARMYINGLNVGGATVMSGVGDMSDITQTLIGTTANTAWPGWADDFRVYVGTVTPEEMYAIFRASHSAFNAMQQIGFSAFNVTFPGQPGGDTKMFLGFNATYSRLDYTMMPALGTSTGSPAVLGDDITTTSLLRGYGINMFHLDSYAEYGGIPHPDYAYVFTTGPGPSRIRAFRTSFFNNNGAFNPVCDFALVLAPGGTIQDEATTTFLARDQGVVLPAFASTNGLGLRISELDRQILPQITAYVMQPRTSYAVAMLGCSQISSNVWLSPDIWGDVSAIVLESNGYDASFGLWRDGPGSPWLTEGNGAYWFFDLEVESPIFVGVNAALDGSSMTVAGNRSIASGVAAATFTVGSSSNLRLDRITLASGLFPESFDCPVALYSASSGLQPAPPSGTPLATGTIGSFGHPDINTNPAIPFLAPEPLAAVTLRHGHRYAVVIGPCSTLWPDVLWGFSTSGPAAGSPDLEPGASYFYDSATPGQWQVLAGDFAWSVDVSREPADTTESVAGSIVVAVAEGCGAVGTYGVSFAPRCDLPCPELPRFQVEAAIAEPDGWCHANRNVAGAVAAPTATAEIVSGANPIYPGDWALWAIRVRTSATIWVVRIRQATLVLPDRPQGPWRRRVLWLSGARTTLGASLSFPPTGSAILYDPNQCWWGPDAGTDSGTTCSRVGVRVNVGRLASVDVLQEGVDTAGPTRVQIEMSVRVEYWNPAFRRKRSEVVREETLLVRLEMTVWPEGSVTGRKLRVHDRMSGMFHLTRATRHVTARASNSVPSPRLLRAMAAHRLAKNHDVLSAEVPGCADAARALPAPPAVDPEPRARFGLPAALSSFVESSVALHAHLRFCAYKVFPNGNYEYVDAGGSRPDFVVEMSLLTQSGKNHLASPKYTEMRYLPGRPEKHYVGGVVLPDGRQLTHAGIHCSAGKGLLRTIGVLTRNAVDAGKYPPGTQFVYDVVDLPVAGEWRSRPREGGSPWGRWLADELSRARSACSRTGFGARPGVEVRVVDYARMPSRGCKSAWPRDKELARLVDDGLRQFWSVFYEPGAADAIYAGAAREATGIQGGAAGTEDAEVLADALAGARIG